MNGKAIFLDRDGVLFDNSDQYYIWKQEQIRFVDGVFDNLKCLLLNGYQLFIVSNQGGISKGLYPKDDILNLHAGLIQTFRNNQIEITEIVFCPHHPEIEKCICRKPDSILIEKLLAKHKLSKEESYLIGDSESDMEAAEKAGIQKIKINSNQDMYPFISFLIR
ncbi:MAG TPA: HAD family hydrolase [Prolixibacteraceae bacterium]|nr:HAD family hydrolase [Prolixibacteraceae bacterium]